MLQNYRYFLTLAETCNISRAAKRLFISHQCLSRYLKNLEDECGLTLFERKPNLALTYAGQILLDSLREVQRVEQNALQALTELRSGNTGEVRLGLTEGRLRIFLPGLLKRYQELFPNVKLKATSAPTIQMLDQLLENKLDLVMGSSTGRISPNLEYTAIFEESLYLVVSDNLLRQYFPDSFPACKKTFAKGVDIRCFQELPFCLTNKGYNSRTLLDEFLQKSNVALNVIYEARQPDLLHIMTAHDYACSFCLSMYLPNIQTLNQTVREGSRLNIFPVKGLTAKNPIYLIAQKDKYFPKYTKVLAQLIQQQCQNYGNMS